MFMIIIAILIKIITVLGIAALVALMGETESGNRAETKILAALLVLQS